MTAAVVSAGGEGAAIAEGAAMRVEWGATRGAQEATAATAAATAAGAAGAATEATGAATEATAAAEHMGTTLLSSHIPFGKNSNTTIPILNIPALHNNTTLYSLYIQ